MPINLYIVSTDDYDYDEYDSVVVTAKDEGGARKAATLLPPSPKPYNVMLIGRALLGQTAGAILHESFNAG